jgi:hypothetical protein
MYGCQVYQKNKKLRNKEIFHRWDMAKRKALLSIKWYIPMVLLHGFKG